MANTYVQCLMHVVFSTKERRQIIPPESQTRLWAYMGGVCKKEGIFVREIGGMPDHVHLFIQQPPTMALSDIVLKIKAASSKWMGPRFAWQRGFGGVQRERV
jgi:REP element-mobilizing transposase RayT